MFSPSALQGGGKAEPRKGVAILYFVLHLCFTLEPTFVLVVVHKYILICYIAILITECWGFLSL